MRSLLPLCLALLLALGVGAAAQTTTPSAILHPGDQLHVLVVGEPELTRDVAVASDGTIGLPLAGEIRVGGATPAAAADAIAAALQKYIRSPQVTVNVASAGHINVLVLGDVVTSGEFQLRPGARLSDAITAAGGMDPSINGDYPVARIALADGTTYHISLDKLLRGGDPERDVVLGDRAAVYVPGPTTFDVSVLGAVDHPGTITLNAGDRLSIAIAKAGNTQSASGDLTRIMVTRTEANGSSASHPVDLYQSLEKGNTLYDPLLRKGDIVYVPVAKQTHGVLTNVLFLLSRLIFL
jgi:polysaccharide export outer membrane protein